MRPTMDQWEIMDILNDSFFRCKDSEKQYVKGWRDAFIYAEKDISAAYEAKVRNRKDADSYDSDKKDTNDPVNHPRHYTSGSIEVIDYIEDQGFGMHLGNAVKYISRAGKKNPEKTLEDLQKASWYLERYIKLLKKQREEDRGGAK